MHVWLFSSWMGVKGCAWEHDVDRDEDSSSCKSSAPLCCREVHFTLEESVVPVCVGRSKRRFLLCLSVFTVQTFVLLRYNIIKAGSFPRDYCVFFP